MSDSILDLVDGATEFDDVDASENFEGASPDDAAPHPEAGGAFSAASHQGRDQNSHVWWWRREVRRRANRALGHWACLHLPMTDLGNAQRFIARHGHNFLYVETWGWLAWDGKRWNGRDAEALMARAVQRTIKAISGEAAMIAEMSEAMDPPRVVRVRDYSAGAAVDYINPVVDIKKDRVQLRSDRLAGWAMVSQSNAHVSCIERLVRPHLTAATDEFDADAMAFNVSNGTLRFGKQHDGYVVLTTHAREDRITKISDVVYDPKATSPLYDAFLNRVQPELDRDGKPRHVQRHLHIMAGVSLTAIHLQHFWFWYGLGRNGKSVLAETWAHVAGEYGQAIPVESFLDQGRSRRGGEASPDIAALPGVRMLRTSEPSRGAKLDEGLVKLVTGGEAMRARHLNRDFFEFKPDFKLQMLGNHKPKIEGTDEGIWRRVLLVPWEVTIPESEVDPQLLNKLRVEAPGILNRMLDGLRDFLDNGLAAPDTVKAATADYRDDSDPIGQFLKDCTAPNPDANEAGGALYKLYVAWAKANGERPFSPKAFSKSMQEHGIRKLKSSGIYYCGVYATATVGDFRGKEFEDDSRKGD